ncbi:MAG: aquaporin [Chthoniobacteraceae bacterium]
MKKLFAEFLGTFGLVFAGTGAIVVNDQTGALGHAGIALTFGLIVLVMIYSFGDVSGAHLNPAATIGFAAAGRSEWRSVPGYIGAQCAGALAASGVLKFLFPASAHLGATLPAGSESQSFVLEVVLTLFLMLVVLSVSTGAKEKGITAGLAIGALIGLEAMFAGPICGASMNPARSLAPALVSGHLEHLWLYVTAPVLGALLAIPACCAVREPGCCRTSA